MFIVMLKATLMLVHFHMITALPKYSSKYTKETFADNYVIVCAKVLQHIRIYSDKPAAIMSHKHST